MADQTKIESTISNDFVSTSSKEGILPSTIYSTVDQKSTLENKVTTISQYNRGLSNCNINPNYSLTKGLINYWSFSGNLNDSIGDSHLFGGMNYNLTLDRFNSSYSAVSLRNGYLDMPSGVYFNSSFTAMAWINVKIFTNWARFFDIGNGASFQNVFFSYTSAMSQLPAIFTFYDSSVTILTSINLIYPDRWHHIAFVLDNQNAYIYIDGVQTGFQSSFIIPQNLVRQKCFIGKSNWATDGLANADFDEIKFFNRALTNQEIISEMANDFCL
jgi:hypothetical protein